MQKVILTEAQGVCVRTAEGKVVGTIRANGQDNVSHITHTEFNSHIRPVRTFYNTWLRPHDCSIVASYMYVHEMNCYVHEVNCSMYMCAHIDIIMQPCVMCGRTSQTAKSVDLHLPHLETKN